MKAIQQRNKLKRPEAAPTRVYDVMLACWKIDSHARMASSDILTAIEDYAVSIGWASDINLTWPDDEREQPARDTTTKLSPSLSGLTVDRDDIEIGKELGKGAFGCVNLGKLMIRTTDGDVEIVDVAIKTLLSDVDQETLEKFIAEADMFARFSHPHIVSLLAVCFDGEPSLIVLELLAGDLKHYLTENRPLLLMTPVSSLIDVGRQVASAMALLEKNSIIHRDLAARFVHS